MPATAFSLLALSSLTPLAAAIVPAAWCSSAPPSTWPVCDARLGLDARAADIVARLSVADKMSALSVMNDDLPFPSIGLPPHNWWSEATHGIHGVNNSAPTPWSSNTIFPITASCAFNRSLWAATGNVIGRDARAFMNVGHADSTFWAPVINIVRDPRWGRNLECAGEDPFLSGEYAVHWVRGFQTAKEAPFPLQAAACCKHFVANELEAWNGTDRHHVDSYVPQQDLVDSYLPSFQACVEQGNVAGVMCSYNAVNGVPSCANQWLLGDLLRGAWQFDGYVTADCDADADVFYSHHFGATPSDSVRLIVAAGTDIDCGGFMTDEAPHAVADGNVTQEQLDVLLRRLFRVRLRLGHFDPPGPLQTIGLDQICSNYSVEVARDGARQGTVLLKNDGRLLPLLGAYQRVAVIGPLMDQRDNTFYYGGTPCFNAEPCPLDSVQQHVASAVVGLHGVPSVSSNDTSGIAAAAAAAADADLVIMVVGSDLSLEVEGHDRLSIAFSDAQLALVAAVAAAAKGPIVVQVHSGGAMDVAPLLANAKVGAVVHAGQPSVQVPGVGDILFGRTPDGRAVAPAGRMSQTVYAASYVDEVSMFDFGMRPGPSAWPPGTNPGRSYRFYSGTPTLPFGFGLSYTTWTYTPLPDPTPPRGFAAVKRAAEAHAANGVLGHIPKTLQAIAAEFLVNVTNTGLVDSDDVVLGFLVPPGAGANGVPLQELFGFERVFVPAGQTVTVYLGAQGVRFTQADADGVRRFLEGDYVARFGVRETAGKGMGFAEVLLKVRAEL